MQNWLRAETTIWMRIRRSSFFRILRRGTSLQSAITIKLIKPMYSTVKKNLSLTPMMKKTGFIPGMMTESAYMQTRVSRGRWLKAINITRCSSDMKDAKRSRKRWKSYRTRLNLSLLTETAKVRWSWSTAWIHISMTSGATPVSKSNTSAWGSS